MNIEPTTESSGPVMEEQDIANSISTRSLFDKSIFNAALDPLKVHLEKESVEQNVLDICLMSGFQIVHRKDREMHQVAPTLQLVLQHGAQWQEDALLEHEMTPCHLICQSTGDHHELLDLMLTSSGGELINTKDSHGFNSLFYAVHNANINCVRTLIAYGADVNVAGPRWCSITRIVFPRPIVMAIQRLQPDSKQSSSIMTDIFDLLLDNGAHMHKSSTWGESYMPIYYAIAVRNVECVIKLIKKGANLNHRDYDIHDFWGRAARLGSVELVKCLLNHGIDKDTKDQHGCSLLTHVIISGVVEAVRYVLDLGVTVTSYTPEVELEPCQGRGTNRLLLDLDSQRDKDDPIKVAVSGANLEIVQMLVEHGSQSCHFFFALLHAVTSSNVGVIEYLLNKYSYPLNVNYCYTAHHCRTYFTILTEPCHRNTTKITKLLLDHGADPNQRICVDANSSILLDAIQHRHEEIIALYIRNGVYINYKSCDSKYGLVLPFEASVLHDRLYVTEMLLVSGCSYGRFSSANKQQIKDDIKSDLKVLMNKWEVDENNVKPLQQQCRRMILNHLSPQADKKIMKMSLPLTLVKYLNIPELDDILTASNNSTRNPNPCSRQCLVM